MSMADHAKAFVERYGPWAFVAGGSDGIGEGFARELAARGLNLILLGRRESVLVETASAIREEHGVDVQSIVADLTANDLMERVIAQTGDLEVGLLVYNAGAVHGAKFFLDQPIEHSLGLVALNCRGPLLLAHHFGAAMRARGRGGIILMSSMAALSGSSYTATYAATKSFDLILAEGLWHEMQPVGVDVMCVLAGATRTPSVLKSTPEFESFPGIMEPTDVARGALASLGKGPCWVAGETNRTVSQAVRAAPRVEIINAMSAAAAQIYGLSHTAASGVDPSELDERTRR